MTDTDPVRRAEAMRREGREHGPAALARGLSDPEPLVSGACVVDLLALPRDAVRAALDGRSDRGTRLFAAACAPRDTAGTQWPYAAWAADEPDPLVRSFLVGAAAAGGRAGAEWLERWADDAHWAVRARLAAALRAAAPDGVRGRLLARLAGDSHPTVARAAAGTDGTGRAEGAAQAVRS